MVLGSVNSNHNHNPKSIYNPKGPFKCYVTQMGVGGGSHFPGNSVTKV